jgi:hypothetical protein
MPTHEEVMKQIAEMHTRNVEDHKNLDREYELATGKSLDQETPECIKAALPILKEKEKSLQEQSDRIGEVLRRAESHLAIAMQKGPKSSKPPVGIVSTKGKPLLYEGRKVPYGMSIASLQEGLAADEKLEQELEAGRQSRAKAQQDELDDDNEQTMRKVPK